LLLLLPLLLALLLQLLLPQRMCCCYSWPKGPVQGTLVQGRLLLQLLVPLQDLGVTQCLCLRQQGLYTVRCGLLLLALLLLLPQQCLLLLLLCEAAHVGKAQLHHTARVHQPD
jgi:hypothetical protein